MAIPDLKYFTDPTTNTNKIRAINTLIKSELKINMVAPKKEIRIGAFGDI